jgi:hypothetical protein
MERAKIDDVVTVRVTEIKKYPFDETGLFRGYLSESDTIGIIWCPVMERHYLGTIIEVLSPTGILKEISND